MTLPEILADIELALAVAKATPLPATGESAVALAGAIETIIKSGLSAYEAHQGEPYDLSNLKDITEV